MSTPIPRLSAAIIVKDEAVAIGHCLDSLSGLAADIVVLDSGSVDGTQALCRARGVRVIETDWPGFGAQKQRAVAAAANDWVLCVDADERISAELASSIRKAMAAPAVTAYCFARRNRFLGRYLGHGEGYPDLSLRLFDRRHARWSEDTVHERVIATGPVEQLSGDLLHDSAETLAVYLTKQNRYTSLAADALTERGVKVGALRLIGSPLLRFIKFYVIRGGFRDGLPGLVHILIGCFNSFMKYAKRLEQQRRS